jgi:hypothetical protein
MDKSVVVSIIGGFVSLVGIWLTHYLAIRREVIFRELQGQPQSAGPDQSLHLSTAASRKKHLNDLRRALFAIVICPLIDVVAIVVNYEFFGWLFPRPGPYRYRLQLLNWDWYSHRMKWAIPLIGPWLYAISIMIILPLLVLFYRRFARKRTRLILCLLTWSLFSSVYFFVDFTLRYRWPDAFTIEVILASTTVAGSISGLVYWLITNVRSQSEN